MQLINVVLDLFRSTEGVGSRQEGSIRSEAPKIRDSLRPQSGEHTADADKDTLHSTIGNNFDDGKMTRVTSCSNHLLLCDSILQPERRNTAVINKCVSISETRVRASDRDEIAEERLRSIGLYWMAVLVSLR